MYIRSRVFLLTCTLIFVLNTCIAQSYNDSATTGKTIMQKESCLFTCIELGIPAGFAINDRGFDAGFVTSAVMGFSLNKNIRVGLGAEFITFKESYLPVIASFELGNHTEKINALLKINAGYTFLLLGDEYYGKFKGGLFAEVLPGVSLGSHISKARYRISLGGQFLSTSYESYLIDDTSTHTRFEDPLTFRVTRIGLVMKCGIDF